MPVYNGEEYINDTISRIMTQSYANFELIVINDGSTDRTKETINKRWNDERIRVIQGVHAGMGAARNIGITNAKGTYITFVDADDFVSSDYLKVLVRGALQHPESPVIAGKFKRTSELDFALFGGSDEYITEEQQIALQHILVNAYDIDVSVWAKLFRRSYFGEKFRFREGLVFEDFEFTVRLLASLNSNDTCVFADKYIYEYFQRPNSVMHRKFSKSELDYLKVIEYCNESIRGLSRKTKIALDAKVISGLGGMYARATIDSASVLDRERLFTELQLLCRNFPSFDTRLLKALGVVWLVKLGRPVATKLLCFMYMKKRKLE